MRSRVRLASALLGAGILAGGLFVALLPSGPPPDIVLMVWDTCRADRLSAYGYPVDTTPWLKEFARDAVLFREAYSPSPWTPPAHGSLFTGLLPRRHGLHHGRGDRVDRRIPLLASTLRDAGYETVSISCNAFISPITGLDAGFERMNPLWNEKYGLGKSPRVLEEVRTWLRERRNAAKGRPRRPLFLFLNFMDPHVPWTPSPEDLRMVLGSPTVPPDVERALGLNEQDMVSHLLGVRTVGADTLSGIGPVYDASIRQLDRMTGEIALRLRAEGILDDAFVAVVGDHGEHLGEHGHLSHQMSLYGEVLHIPMVVRWPGRLDGGRVEPAQVRLQDLYPTILEAARVPPPPGTGTDATTLTESPLRSRLHRAEFHRPLPFLAEARSVLTDAGPETFDKFRISLFCVQDPADAPRPRKLVIHERVADGGPSTLETEELFDLAADPREMRNLLVDPSPEDRAAADRLRAER